MKSKLKSTHKGECQFCEKIHKMPNGRITKHGYTVVKSEFAGVCLGSGLLPYNLSCEDITAVLIPQIEKIATRLRTQANRVKIDATYCWVKVYDSETRFYYWVEGIIKEKKNYVSVSTIPSLLEL